MNLKEAARRLGVHYQTAYRWVRSGELVAVRVGSRYEVSEAAIERLRARRRALGSPRLDDAMPVREDLEAELAKMADGPVLDVEQAVVHLSRRIAESTGDMCVVGLLSAERDRVEVASCFEPDSQRLPILAGAIAATLRMRAADEGPIMRTIFEGNELFVPHVPQELIRAWLPREFHQQFDDVCIFGMMVAPMFHEGIAFGGIAVMRERPDQPLTTADADRLHRLAILAGDVIVGARHDRTARDQLAVVSAAVQAEVDQFGTLDAERAIRARTEMVAIHDGIDRPIAMTPAYLAIAQAVQSRSTGRIVSGELDFSSDVCHDESDGFVVHHAAIRLPDATLAAIVTVARRIEGHAAPPAPPRLSTTLGDAPAG
jgi:excisionase family DNA binding protein